MKPSHYRRRFTRPAPRAGAIVLALALVFLFILSSRLGNSQVAARTRKTPLTASVRPSLAAQAKAKAATIADKGDFKVVYTKVKNKDFAKFQTELQREKVLEGIAADLNDTFALPTDVYLTFTECGEANAFYDPETRKLSMCYELIEDFYEVFAKHEKSPEALDDAVIGATIHTFFHELGHAFIHIYDLPITGKEEDAVDQLSTYLLADGTDEGEKAALDGARAFYLEAQRRDSNIEELAYWDEHSLGMQRFYNIICLVYGQNEKKFDYLVKKEILPEDRAARCADEYAQVEKAWTKLLAPYIKK
ncbi:MAG: DUF4344 domain-containing metallopeptidase [Acidobacteria bacterium]|nr:DUF4344 domain-containing metallopeptidase [Acidobacteriota bacterium]